jgi:hypothetical protein
MLMKTTTVKVNVRRVRGGVSVKSGLKAGFTIKLEKGRTRL